MAHYERLSDEAIAEIAGLVAKAQETMAISLSELARRAGVSQPMAHSISRARFKCRTPNLRKLELYVRIALGERDGDIRSLDREVVDFLGAGGSVEELRTIIAACTAARRSW